MNVELRHLRALAAIGDAGTITDAAAALRITQPAVSRTLDQLEKRVGARLVERTTRHLVLTETGGRLWERAHQVLAQLDDALSEVAGGGTRPLRVGFAWAGLGRMTVPLLQQWREDYPDTPVRVHRCDDPERALRRSEIDVAFLRTSPPAEPDYEAVSLFSEQRWAALAEEDPLANADSLRLADLVTRTVALCSTAATTHVSLWPLDNRPRTIDVANVDEWLTVIATGDAVGVTAEGTSHSHPHPEVRYRPIRDVTPVTVHLVSPCTPTHSATQAFREHVLRTVRAHERSARI